MNSDRLELLRLNEAPRDEAIRLLEPLVERAPWVAELTVDLRPFSTDQDVAQKLINTILEAGFDKRLVLFRGHPELAGIEALSGKMTDASTSEQARLGLTALAPSAAKRLSQMNAEYRKRFSHPFILALHRIPDLETVFDVFEIRLASSPVEEHAATLAEIASVISSRSALRFGKQTPSVTRPTEASYG